MTRSVGKAVLIVASAAVVAASAAWTRPASSREPHLMTIGPMVYVETKATGEQIAHQCLQAHIQAPLATIEADLPPMAKKIFDRRLRTEAEAGDKHSVWITFHFADAEADLQGTHKTFRVIYVRDGADWRVPTRM